MGYETCGFCNGHRWRVWRQIEPNGTAIPLVKACKCNIDGKAMPPIIDANTTEDNKEKP